MERRNLFWVVFTGQPKPEKAFLKGRDPLAIRGFYQYEAAKEEADYWNSVTNWKHSIKTTSECIQEGVELP